MPDTTLCVATILLSFCLYIESLYIDSVRQGGLHNGELSHLRRRPAVSGFMAIHGNRLESLGCWRDAWSRALPSLEGSHYLLMEPNYKARTHALFKCARAAKEKKFKMFGLENGGQCFGTGAMDTAFKKYGPAKNCRGDGKGGPWSLEVYRFQDNTAAGNRATIQAKYGPWSPWSACSRTCGTGVRLRKRKCFRPVSILSSRGCAPLGPSVGSLLCNVQPCAGGLMVGEVETSDVSPAHSSRKPLRQPELAQSKAHAWPGVGSTREAEKSFAMTGVPLQQSLPLPPKEALLKQSALETNRMQGEPRKTKQVLEMAGSAELPQNPPNSLGKSVDDSRSYQMMEPTFDSDFYTFAPTRSPPALASGSSSGVTRPKEAEVSRDIAQGGKQNVTGNGELENNATSHKGGERGEDNQTKSQDEAISSGMKPDQNKPPEADGYGSTPDADSWETQSAEQGGSAQGEEQQLKDSHGLGISAETTPQQMDAEELGANPEISTQQMDQMNPTQSIAQAGRPVSPDYEQFSRLNGMAPLENQNAVASVGKDQDSSPAPSSLTSSEMMANSSEALPNTPEVVPNTPEAVLNTLHVTGNYSAPNRQTTSGAENQDNGRAHDESAQCLCPSKVCSAKADMAFVVDSSADIPELYFSRVLAFVKALSRGFDLRDTHVGLMAYGNDAKPAFNLTPLRSHAQLDRMVDSAAYMGGDLRIGNALLLSKQQLFESSGRQDAPRALVLFSSGSSFDDAGAPAAELRDSGVKVTAVGLGKLANVRELINAASEPKAEHVFTAFLDTLPSTMDGIVQGVCKDVLGILQDRTKPCTCSNDFTSGKQASYDTGSGAQNKEQPGNHSVLPQSSENPNNGSSERQDSSELGGTEISHKQSTAAPQGGSVQITDEQETPPSDSSMGNSAIMPEADVQNGRGAQLTQQSVASPAHGALSESTGNKTRPDHLATAEHVSSDNYKEHEGCGSVNLGIVLDSSDNQQGSDSHKNRKMMELVKKITHLFPVSSKGNRVGMLVYSGSTQPSVVRLDDFHDQASLDKAIDDAKNPNMQVTIGKALDLARDHLFRNTAPGKLNVLLLVTDGTSSDDVVKPAIELKRRNVEIFCFGVGEEVVRSELAAIASQPTESHVFVTPTERAPAVLGSIRRAICRAANANQIAQGYCASDLEFLVDGSRSIEVLGRGNFRKVLHFVKNVTRGLNVSPGGTRVGLTVYGSDPREVVPLQYFDEVESLARAIDGAPFPASAKMTGRALAQAANALFGAGTRPRVPKVLVVLSGGTSRDSVIQSAADLHRRGVRVISVGLGAVHDRKELSDMASSPLEENILLVRFSELGHRVTDLQARICRAPRGVGWN